MTGSDDIFLAPVLRGRRFDGHTVPVEVLADLAAYKELVQEVARRLFLDSHPGRKRVPKGFEDSFRLTLKQIDRGSAIPVLIVEDGAEELTDENESGGGDRLSGWFLGARDVIAECVLEVAAGRQPPARFPREQLAAFNRFGRSLLPDESIELAPNLTTRGVTYNPIVRRQLVLLQSDNYEKPLTLVGTVIEIHAENAHFTLRTPLGQFMAPYPVDLESTVIEALRNRSKVDVRLMGMGSFDSSERLLRITDVTHMVPIDDAVSEASADIIRRLTAMAELQAGWLDGEGVAPERENITWASQILQEVIDREGLVAPKIFPTPEGHILAEWPGAPWSIEARFRSGSRKIDVVADNLSENRDVSVTIEVSDDTSSALAGWLRPYLAGARRSS